jgi:ADP-heptose:LPS heptosyltransferase
MNLQLVFHQCAGDTLVATAAVHSLHVATPEVKLRVVGGHSELIFENNRDVSGFEGKADRVVAMDNPLIDESHLPWHFLHSFCRTLSSALETTIPLRCSRPRLFLSEQELAWAPRIQELTGRRIPYWLVCRPGAKDDYTVKRYPTELLQTVIDYFRGRLQFVQVGEKEHRHEPLRGTINEIGQTDLRQLIRLAYWADGILTGDSVLWHIAAAFNKPAVCVASGWLSKHWITYPSQTLLSKHGCLPCCREKACAKTRVVDLHDNDPKSSTLCEFPVFGFSDPTAKCMAMISPAEIVRAIESYLM